MTSSLGFSMSSQKGWAASMSCAISDGAGSQTTSPPWSIQLRTAADYANPPVVPRTAAAQRHELAFGLVGVAGFEPVVTEPDWRTAVLRKLLAHANLS